MSDDERPAKRHAGGHGLDDRLSALPDALLHSVMFYLPARQAVQTCALSRRWRHLWRSAASLDVDSRADVVVADDDDNTSSKFFLREMRWGQLRRFATRLLEHHSGSAPTLDRFRLRVRVYEHDADVRTQVVGWILRGAAYRPTALEISLSLVAANVRLPPLGPTSGRLRRLCLAGVVLDSGFADHLRTACPVLEDLELSNCGFDDFQEIVSGTLRSLTCYGCFASRRPYGEKWHVRVTAPSLVSVTYGSQGYRLRRRRLRKDVTLTTLLLSPQVNDGLERAVPTTYEIVMLILS